MNEVNTVERPVKPRLCCADAWTGFCDDPEPHAVRWARRTDRFRDAVWGKWHYTEGNALFTACGENVVPFEVDGSPEEREIEVVTCKRCLSKMARYVRHECRVKRQNLNGD